MISGKDVPTNPIANPVINPEINGIIMMANVIGILYAINSSRI